MVKNTKRVIGAILCACSGWVMAQDAYVAVKVEAESFSAKGSDWYLTSSGNSPNVSPDPDPAHTGGASGGGYVELLPDTRVTHGDKLEPGRNFWNTAGTGPRLDYRVNFPEAGKYIVYARAYSTGSEDNGIHVGINGQWPASGARMQWCTGKNGWTWSSAQRVNSNHCGTERTITLDVPAAGSHQIMFSAREDGFELDAFMLVKETGGSTCTVKGEGNVDCNGGGEGQLTDGGNTTGNNGGETQLGLYHTQTDLISLQYDFAPDPDDGHATTAGRHLTAVLGIEPLVVYGAYGAGNRSRFDPSSRPLMNQVWGPRRYIDANSNWNGGVRAAAEAWGEILQRGGKVLVAEGGQSDFTADVIRAVKSQGVAFNKKQMVVVQHSAWNEKMADQNDLSYVKNNATYVKIQDGNHQNATADLNQKSSAFVSRIVDTDYGDIWRQAFNYLNPSRSKLDFSDTVELLHILGIGKDQIADPMSFLNTVEQSDALQERGGSTGDGGGSSVLITDTGGKPAAGDAGSAGGGSGGTTTSVSNTGACVASGRSLSAARSNYAQSCRAARKDCDPVGGEWLCSSQNIATAAVSSNHGGEACTASGSDLGAARVNYAQRCPARRVDCDPVNNGEWICSSHTITTGSADPLYTMAIDNATTVNGIATARDYSATDYYPICVDATTDTVGDGFGWQNQAICIVTEQSDQHENTQAWVSCESADNTINRIGKNGDGQGCVVTNDTYGIELNITSVGGGQATADSTIEQAAGNYDGVQVTQNKPQDTVPVLVNDGRDDINAQRDRVVNFPPSLSPQSAPWSDSYSVAGQCYCDTNFDHGLRGKSVETPQGTKSVPQVCAAIQAKYGSGSRNGRTYFNTAQCGHGPVNTANDETVCPGIPVAAGNYTGPNCRAKGSTWNLDLLYSTKESRVAESRVATPSGRWWQPKASSDLKWQLQLQGDLVLQPGVAVYAVDYSASQDSIDAAKATGAKVMCYISAGSAENWRSDFGRFPRSVVGNAYEGWPGEWWLDTSKIEALAPIMVARIEACQRKGFDAIDADNVNGYQNDTGFDISAAESIRYIQWLASEAHARGLAFSLKNAASLVPQVINDIDMLQSESCFRHNECAATARVTQANKPVFAVEYAEIVSQAQFNQQACASARQYQLSMIYRDLLLTPDGPYRACAL